MFKKVLLGSFVFILLLGLCATISLSILNLVAINNLTQNQSEISNRINSIETKLENESEEPENPSDMDEDETSEIPEEVLDDKYIYEQLFSSAEYGTPGSESGKIEIGYTDGTKISFEFPNSMGMATIEKDASIQCSGTENSKAFQASSITFAKSSLKILVNACGKGGIFDEQYISGLRFTAKTGQKYTVNKEDKGDGMVSYFYGSLHSESEGIPFLDFSAKVKKENSTEIESEIKAIIESLTIVSM